jgi:uracil-DNA glycosylase
MVQIEASWKKELLEEFEKPYFLQIVDFLKREKAQSKIIYPPGSQIFNAFNTTPFDQVKVIILGQDPYHGVGQAMGLSFSVSKNVAIPASLKNIYKEIQSDIGLPIPQHGDLTGWAKQGVFLLNAMLTVEASLASSHKNIGWQSFTDAVIQRLSTEKTGLVFLLWGNFAKAKKELIDTNKHLVLEAAHPSPLAGGAFFGCKHFSKTNEYLEKNGQIPINWGVE